MADIDLSAPHHRTLPEARTMAEQIIADVAQRYGLKHGWQGDQLEFSGKGVDGNATLDDENVRIVVKLKLLMKALKGPIEAEIRKRLAAL